MLRLERDSALLWSILTDSLLCEVQNHPIYAQAYVDYVVDYDRRYEVPKMDR